MSFLDRLFGKTPSLEDMENAVWKNDAERVEKLAKRLSPEIFKTMLNPLLKRVNKASMLTTIDGVLKQKKMALTLTPNDKKVVAAQIGKLIFQNSDYLTKENVDFMRQHLSDDKKKFSLSSFKDKDGLSVYDKDQSFGKERYFAVATESEIGHEFRKAVVDLDIEKVSRFMENYKKAKGRDINPDIANERGMTGMRYMAYLMEKAGRNDVKMADKIEKMTSFLYNSGAKLTDEKGNSLFAADDAAVLGKLLPDMEKRNDEAGLKLAEQMAKRVLERTSPTGRIGPVDANMVRRLVEKEQVGQVRASLSKQSPTERMAPVDATLLRKALSSSSQK